jgi:mRNA interferase MazF
LKRGDVVLIALQGDMGKPRPAVIVQNDLFATHQSFVILPLTSELRDAPLMRFTVEPTSGNGLEKPSQVMVDKITTVAIGKIGKMIGQLEERQMVGLNQLMAVFLGVV